MRLGVSGLGGCESCALGLELRVVVTGGSPLWVPVFTRLGPASVFVESVVVDWGLRCIARLKISTEPNFELL